MSAIIRRVAGSSVALGVLLTAGCGSDSDSDATEATTASTDAAASEVTEAAETSEDAWSYTGEGAPANWGELNSDYETCATGTSQSPIDLTSAMTENIEDIEFSYGESPLAIFNNGHTIEVEPDEGANSIMLSGTEYEVAQFHFHAGSEHLVDGEQFPLEMHIVHTAGDSLAVVGVMVDVGAENEALASVFANIPTEVAEEAELIEGASVDLDAVLPTDRTYFQYSGSLTTPPCSEGVAWNVLETPIEISEAQLAAFTDVIDGNFRPVQPLNDRGLLLDSD